MKILTLTMAVFLSFLCGANEVIVPFEFQQFCDEDVGALFHDEFGAMWISSSSNLYRSNSNVSTLIEGPLIGNCISGNRRGTIYAVKFKNLLKISTASLKYKSINLGVPLSNSTALLAEGDSLWVGAGNELLLIRGDSISKKITFRDEEIIAHLLRSSNEDLLLGTSLGTVYRIADFSPELICHRRTPIHFLYEDSDAVVWTAGGNIVSRLDGLESFSVEGVARTICQTSNGSLLVGTTVGLFRINSRGQVSKFDIGLGSNEPITCLSRDGDDAVWIGTYYEGLRYFNEANTHFTRIPVNCSKVKDIIFDETGRKFIFTDGDGLSILFPYGRVMKVPDTDRMKIQGAVRVEDEVFAANFNNGITIYHIDKGTIRSVRFDKENVNAFSIEKAGSQIVVGTNSGVYLFDPASETIISRKIDGFGNLVYSLSYDGSRLWIGSNGLFYSDDLTGVNHFEQDKRSPLFSMKCCSFERQPDGSLLFAIYGAGICRLMPDGRKLFYNRANCALSTDDISMCTSVRENIIIAGHSNGIIVIDTDQMASNNYDCGENLPISSLRGGQIRKNGNILYFFGKRGVISTDIEGVRFFNPKTIAKIDRFSVNGTARELTEDVTLRYDENNLAFGISTFDFNPVSSIVARCQLVGFEEYWREIPNSGIIEYPNLSTGKYKLRVKCGLNEDCTEETSSFSFTIKPIWYKTSGFIFLWIALSTLLVSWILSILYSRVVLRERLRNQMNLTEERNRMFIDISHKLRTPLTMILGQMELFFSTHNDKFPGRGHIESSYENALKMRGIISDFVDFENSAEDDSIKFSGDYKELSLSTLKISNRKMLIVDDNIEIRMLLHSIFSLEFHTYEASNGNEGIEMARSVRPDIIISDVMMPKMDGIEMTARLREDVLTQNIPIILLTAHASEKHNLEGLLVGADDYITKPFSNELLKARVNNLLLRRENRLKTIIRDNKSENPEQIDFLNSVIASIEHNLPNVDVRSVCRDLGMSRTNLGLKLREAVGMSPRDYIEDVKLRIATNMLWEGVYHISEISDQLGFSSSNYFTLRFKKKYGCAPSKYRKTN